MSEYRNGSEINAIMHAAKALGAESVPLSDDTVLMSGDRVSLLEVTHPDGDPMGCVFAKYTGCAVPVKGWVDLPDDVVEVRMVEDSIVFENDDRMHRVRLTEGSKPPRIPNVKLEIVTGVEAKRLRNAVKLLKGISDYVILLATHGTLYMGANNGETEVLTPLCECIDEGTARYPTEHIERISKVLDGWVRILFSTDSPLSLEWGTGETSFMWMVAPRFEYSEVDE